MKTFKEWIVVKEASSNDWRAESAAPTLQKGFVPPTKLRPIIRAFLASGDITLQKDTGGKHINMPKKTLYLVGGPVRDFLKGKTIKDLDLATNATPEQIGTILSAAGFKRVEDRSGKGGSELTIPNKIYNVDGEEIKLNTPVIKGDNKIWYIKGRDNSAEQKPFVIGAVVDGEEFEIATFRKDAKVTDGQAAVDFVDNPKDDAARRDLTINALYIELNNAEGENKKLYDPTGHGLYDIKNGIVRTVGKPEDRFDEDPLRIFRAIRFHSRFGSTEQLDKDIQSAIPKFLSSLPERVALERIRDEFLKGLLHPDIDTVKYLNLYQQNGLLNVVFPDLKFDLPNSLPEFAGKKDKVLALAWLLQHNPTEKVASVLGAMRNINGANKPTGWQQDERKAIAFLLKLKEFSPDDISKFLREREGTGLTSEQIKKWSSFFPLRPTWQKQMKHVADYTKGITWQDAKDAGHHLCPVCKGNGCGYCKNTGEIPPHQRGEVVGRLEADKFKQKLHSDEPITER